MINAKYSCRFTAYLCLLLALTGQSTACTTDAWSLAAGSMSADKLARFDGNCGLRVDLSGTEPAWVEDSTLGSLSTPVTEYVARFYTMTGDTVLSDGEALTLLSAVDSVDGDLFGVELVGTSGGNILQIYAHNGTALEFGATTVAMPKGWRALEIQWSSISGNASFGIDGVEHLISISGLNNTGQQIAKVMLGAVAGNTPGVSGTVDLDAFVSRRSDTTGLVDKNCSGSIVNVDNITFLPGTKNCEALTSLSFGERVVFDSGSRVNVSAPVVVLTRGTHIPGGAVLSVQ